jgi:sugar phosphate isomerase/epimerase
MTDLWFRDWSLWATIVTSFGGLLRDSKERKATGGDVEKVRVSSMSRRHFLAGAAAFSGAAWASVLAQGKPSQFKVAVISDEISQDFDHACSVIARDFDLQWVELRELWGKNLQELSSPEIAEATKILKKYDLQVTDIASPLFKVDWPDAPKSPYSPQRDMHGASKEVGYSQQSEVLAHSIALAKQFRTDKVRCFDFWRLEDVKPHRAAINEQLRAAAETAGKEGVLLVLENEFACNTATGREAAEVLGAIPSVHLALNWDPGNAVKRGELDAFPGGWDALPKGRVHHCHCKNAAKQPSGEVDWSPVGTGYIDWVAQFRAMKKAGFKDAVSLETHWHGGGTPEASSRVSWMGMKQALRDAGVV